MLSGRPVAGPLTWLCHSDSDTVSGSKGKTEVFSVSLLEELCMPSDFAFSSSGFSVISSSVGLGSCVDLKVVDNDGQGRGRTSTLGCCSCVLDESEHLDDSCSSLPTPSHLLPLSPFPGSPLPGSPLPGSPLPGSPPGSIGPGCSLVRRPLPQSDTPAGGCNLSPAEPGSVQVAATAAAASRWARACWARALMSAKVRAPPVPDRREPSPGGTMRGQIWYVGCPLTQGGLILDS